MGGLLKQAQKMQREMLRIQEELGAIEVEGSAGGGIVTVKANAKGEILGVKIEPDAVDPQDVEMLEDTILAAIHDAVEKAQGVSNEKLGAITGGMGGIPGMPGF